MCTSNTIKKKNDQPDYREGQTILISHIRKKDASCCILLFLYTLDTNCILLK